jgi:hypothetical protein
MFSSLSTSMIIAASLTVRAFDRVISFLIFSVLPIVYAA